MTHKDSFLHTKDKTVTILLNIYLCTELTTVDDEL